MGCPAVKKTPPSDEGAVREIRWARASLSRALQFQNCVPEETKETKKKKENGKEKFNFQRAKRVLRALVRKKKNNPRRGTQSKNAFSHAKVGDRLV